MILIDFVSSSNGSIGVNINDIQIIAPEEVRFYGRVKSIKLVSLIDRINAFVPGKVDWNFE